jgi:small subunit ribosomal protein S7
MPRRNSPPKRAVMPDKKYDSTHVAMFINRMMKGGKKSTASKIMYSAFDIIEERAKKNPVEVFEQAIRNVTPVLEVKPKRVGGSTYQVPLEVPPARALSLAMRWLLQNSHSRPGKGMAVRLASELMDAAAGQGASIKKKDDTHRMADANKAFAHFR